jgi:hypothetical protein
MDFSAILPVGMPSVAELAAAPDYVWAALASAVVTLGLALAFTPRREGAATSPVESDPPDAASFLIHGSTLQPMSEAARALAQSLPAGPGRLAALRAHLVGDCPRIDADLEALILYGVGFRHLCPRPDGGVVEVLGAPRGAAAFLTIRRASDEARARR